MYETVLVVHILTAIVGFGGLVGHSMYSSRALRGTAGDAVVLFDSTVAVSRMAYYAIYAVGPLGVVLITLDADDPIEFSSLWISLSFLTWFAMIGLGHALITRNLKATIERAGQLDPSSNFADDRPGVDLLKKVALGDLLVQTLLIVSVALMVWQPG